MNKHIDDLLYQAGLTAQGCWDELGTYEQEAIEKFALLIVRECIGIVAKRKDQAIDDGCNVDEAMSMAEMDLEEHFGVEE